MSKENLKKSKKNYWFSITLIALALFCVGAALLYSQKLLSEKLSTPKAPVASYTARYGARSISKVQFLKRDMLLDKDETSINWLKSIRTAQRKKNIKHLYDEYKNVGIFQVTEDVKYNSLFESCILNRKWLRCWCSWLECYLWVYYSGLLRTIHK